MHRTNTTDQLIQNISRRADEVRHGYIVDTQNENNTHHPLAFNFVKAEPKQEETLHKQPSFNFHKAEEPQTQKVLTHQKVSNNQKVYSVISNIQEVQYDGKHNSPSHTSIFSQQMMISGVKMKEVAGIGEYGVVRKGRWVDIDVAIKVLPNQDENSIIALCKEAEVQNQTNHPNVVRFFGIWKDPSGKYTIVNEWVNGGSLKKILDEERLRVESNQMRKYSNNQLLKICYQVALAMESMETRGIVHADLAARNIMIEITKNNKLIAKVNDFGLSKITNRANSSKILSATGDDEEPIPYLWSAPEVISEANFSSRSDVWSFGVLMWEIFSLGETPYDSLYALNNPNQISRSLSLLNYLSMNDENRLGVPEFATPEIYEQMLVCWNYDLYKRPTFHLLALSLKQIYRLNKSSEKITRMKHSHNINKIEKYNNNNNNNNNNNKKGGDEDEKPKIKKKIQQIEIGEEKITHIKNQVEIEIVAEKPNSVSQRNRFRELIQTNLLVENDNLIASFGSRGAESSQFFSPHFLTMNSELEMIAVSDYNNNRVQIFNKDAKYCGEISIKSPTGIVIIKKFNILVVASCADQKVYIYNIARLLPAPIDDLLPLNTLGAEGSGQNEFNFPCGIAYNDENDFLFIGDSDNKRIQIYKVNGTRKIVFRSSFALNFSAWDIAVSSSPDLLILSNPSEHVVEIYSISYQNEMNFSKLKQIGIANSPGSENTHLFNPRGVGIHPFAKYILVCDRGNSRLQFFNLVGEFICSFKPNHVMRESKRVPVYFQSPFGVCIEHHSNLILVTDTKLRDGLEKVSIIVSPHFP